MDMKDESEQLRFSVSVSHLLFCPPNISLVLCFSVQPPKDFNCIMIGWPTLVAGINFVSA